MQIIDLSPSPEPELRPPAAAAPKKMPLFLPDEPDVIEISDSEDDGVPVLTGRKRRKVSTGLAVKATEAEYHGSVVCPADSLASVSPRPKPRKVAPRALSNRAGPSRLTSRSPSIIPRIPSPPTMSNSPTPSHSTSFFTAHGDGEDADFNRDTQPVAGPSREQQVGTDHTMAGTFDLPQIPEDMPDLFPQDVMAVEDLLPLADQHELNISRVCEIVPDVSLDYVSDLLKRNQDAFPNNLVEAVIQILFEGPYPKAGQSKGKAKADTPDAAIDFTSVDRTVKDLKKYSQLALAQLKEDFPDIPAEHLTRAFETQNKLYVPTFLLVERERASNKILLGNADVASGKTSRRKKGKGKAPSNHVEFMLEHAWLVEKRKADLEAKDAELAQELGDEDAGIDCGCCFTSYSFSKMIQCPEAHLFCTDCITAYASSRLGEQNHRIPCMDQDGCKAEFTDSELRRVLPSKLLELYERTRQRFDVEAAAIEGLEECPFCDFKVVFELDADTDKLLRCQNEGCSKVSCRKCKKEDHLPKSCQEAEEDRKLEGKHAVEEAMTKALMRNCPKCQKAFIKESGCNKMICPACQTMSCYVCRQAVSGYEHFDRTPHNPRAVGSSSDKKLCPLWDPVDVRHADEVAAAAKQAQVAYKANNPDAEDADLHVDLPEAPRPPEIPHPHLHHPHHHQPRLHHVHFGAHHPQLQPGVPEGYPPPLAGAAGNMLAHYEMRLQQLQQQQNARRQEAMARAQDAVRRQERERQRRFNAALAAAAPDPGAHIVVPPGLDLRARTLRRQPVAAGAAGGAGKRKR